MDKVVQNSAAMQIELKNISKSYGKIVANHNISLCIQSGCIHGLLGENGAGKSTLMKILAGFIPMSSGTVLLDGIPANYHTPKAAAKYGIDMLYQEPLDFPNLSVIENFMSGQVRGFRYNRTYWVNRLKTLCDQFDFKLSPLMPVSRLTVGERQQLALLRKLETGINVLILDEPTIGISSTQKELLFSALRKLAFQQKIVIIVSHKLEDVELLCDRITVLRQGRVSGEIEKPFSTRSLLEMMFSNLPKKPNKGQRAKGKDILKLKDVSGGDGRVGLSECSITIHEGEVVGLAGLEGSGQSIFLRIACGINKPESGAIELCKKNLTGKDYHLFNKYGATFMPANRLEEGLISELSITEHFALKQQKKGFLVPWSSSRIQAKMQIEKFSIIGHPESLASSLSGGNQQRLMLSFLPLNPKLLLLESPTRGLDLESVYRTWQYLQKFLEKGVSIIFSSSELDEIVLFADRILVFFEGRIVKDVCCNNVNLDELERAIAGKC